MSKSFKKDRDFFEEDDRKKKKYDRVIRQIKKHRREVDMKQEDTRPKK